MLRLVQGDVGCGKTVVAALAALQRGGGRPAGGADGAHRAARRAAPAKFSALAGAARHRGGAPDRAAAGGGADARCWRRSAAARPRWSAGTQALFQKDVTLPRSASCRRRAAPLRRAPAPRAAREGRAARASAASADHDRDTDPAHAGDDGLRRPRHLGHRRAAARAHAGADGGDPDSRRDEVVVRIREACARAARRTGCAL